ncbi:hypothetical protein L6452_17953 [Arctium lappa]|uniref:Uncharacterized protein n=1 Tax=Arctium lappa TaxID=4217 RepID=A0ACB9C4T4_ARCLA|nr:hypothetical protein L6452_17953 [Arctium lappa]
MGARSFLYGGASGGDADGGADGGGGGGGSVLPWLVSPYLKVLPWLILGLIQVGVDMEMAMVLGFFWVETESFPLTRDMEEEHQNYGLSMVCDTDLEEEHRFVEFGGQKKV